MLSIPAYIACFVLSLSLTIIIKYVFEFLNFNREQEYKKTIEEINQRVDDLLSYKFEDKQVIDILDYMEYEENMFVDRDAMLEEMCSHRLTYSPRLKTWIKK